MTKMKKNLMKSLMMLLTTSLVLVSCSSDDSAPVIPTATVSVEIPDNIKEITLSNVQAVLTNVENGAVMSLSDNYTVVGNKILFNVSNVSQGVYNVLVKGHLVFTTISGVQGEQDFEVRQNNVQLSTSATALNLVISTFKAESGFVISEIYSAGSLTPENKNYTYDAYFVITNNSDVTLYADSIALMETAYNSQASGQHDWNPDFRPTAFSAQALFMIPGDGKTYPVEPGQSIVIANNAMDHRTANVNSVDLSGADFEVFLNAGGSSSVMDVDYDATNLVYVYCYTNTIWIPSIQQNRSYAIARMKEDVETFIANHSVVPHYIASTGKEMSSSEVQVPNEWILDAVNLGQADDFAWYIISEALDAGFVVGRNNNSDTTQRGTSVIRKQDANGKYIDTNNSTNDFLNRQTPSLKK